MSRRSVQNGLPVAEGEGGNYFLSAVISRGGRSPATGSEGSLSSPARDLHGLSMWSGSQAAWLQMPLPVGTRGQAAAFTPVP